MPFPRYAPDGVSWTLARNRPPANKKAGQCPAFSIPHKLSSADALQHRGDALTHADAHRREAELGVLVVQYMRQFAGNARTRKAEPMAEGARHPPGNRKTAVEGKGGEEGVKLRG